MQLDPEGDRTARAAGVGVGGRVRTRRRGHRGPPRRGSRLLRPARQRHGGGPGRQRQPLRRRYHHGRQPAARGRRGPGHEPGRRRRLLLDHVADPAAVPRSAGSGPVAVRSTSCPGCGCSARRGRWPSASRLSVRTTLAVSSVMGLALAAAGAADRRAHPRQLQLERGAAATAVRVRAAVRRARRRAAVDHPRIRPDADHGRRRADRPAAGPARARGAGGADAQRAAAVLAWIVPYLPATLLSWLPARRLAAANRTRRAAAPPSGFSIGGVLASSPPRGR